MNILNKTVLNILYLIILFLNLYIREVQSACHCGLPGKWGIFKCNGCGGVPPKANDGLSCSTLKECTIGPETTIITSTTISTEYWTTTTTVTTTTSTTTVTTTTSTSTNMVSYTTGTPISIFSSSIGIFLDSSKTTHLTSTSTETSTISLTTIVSKSISTLAALTSRTTINNTIGILLDSTSITSSTKLTTEITSVKNTKVKATKVFNNTEITTSINPITTTGDTTVLTFNNKITTILDLTTKIINPINLNDPIEIYNLLTLPNQDITPCLINCSNNGACQIDSSTRKLSCKCDQYFTGSQCNLDTRPCSFAPCLNNATCINKNLTSSGYLCECNEFYTGINCEIQIDLCHNETCSNNGKCNIVNNKPMCECFQHYSGARCETQSQTLVNIKKFIGTTSIIAIILIISFYFLILISDILKFYMCEKKSKYKRYRDKHKIFKPIYLSN